MHAEISLTWQAKGRIREATGLNDDQYRMLAEGFPQLDLPQDRKTLPEYSGDWAKRHIIDLEVTGALLADLGLDFELHRFTSTYRLRSATTHNETNIHVAIPNLLLFAVDEVMVLEDVCTDKLQDSLDKGWRILAVCPPAAQRRPDYVLGRQKGGPAIKIDHDRRR